MGTFSQQKPQLQSTVSISFLESGNGTEKKRVMIRFSLAAVGCDKRCPSFQQMEVIGCRGYKSQMRYFFREKSKSYHFWKSQTQGSGGSKLSSCDISLQSFILLCFVIHCLDDLIYQWVEISWIFDCFFNLNNFGSLTSYYSAVYLSRESINVCGMSNPEVSIFGTVTNNAFAAFRAGKA